MIGRRFGRLVVLSRAGSKGKNILWKCRCDCGTETEVLTHHLTSLKDGTRSCGCLKKELRQQDMIECKICHIPKPKSSDFYRKSSGQTVNNICKSCHGPILNEAKKQRNKRDRQAALRAYGGEKPVCACRNCKESHYEFLTIDHINGGGSQHRREVVKGSGDMYRWLRNNNYPPGFRVLCWNCNLAIALYGKCPHERERNART